MGLENTRPDFRPEDFNVNWPEGSDDYKYGDDHIRLIKLATYNFWQDFGDYKVNIDGLFNGSKVKEAEMADDAAKLNGEDPDQFARIDGDYNDLRARATTKDDVGLNRVSNYYISNSATSASTTNYASSFAVATAYDRANQAINLANSFRDYASIGSYIFAEDVSNTGTVKLPGSTLAGSQLRPSGSTDFFDDTYGGRKLDHFTADDYPLPGTWRCMGYSVSSAAGFNRTPRHAATLWVRIS